MSLSKPKCKFVLPAFNRGDFPSKMSVFNEGPQVEEWMNWTLNACAASKDESKKVGPIISYIGYYYSNSTVWDDRVEFDFQQKNYSEQRALKLITQVSQLLSKFENKMVFVAMTEWDPSVLAMYACIDAIYEAFNETQRKYFIFIWRKYMNALIDEYRLVRQLKSFETVEEMVKIRVNSCGMEVFLQMVELCEQLYLPVEVRSDPRISKLENLVAEHFTTLNDVISFENEYNVASCNVNAMNNSVAFYFVIKGISIEDAMKKLVEEVKELEKQFIKIRDEILIEETCLDVTKKYINSLNLIVGGNYDSMIGSKRYYL